MKKFLKKAEGFTLVELIVVIAILGILAAIAVPTYSGYVKKANEANDTQTLSAVNTALAAAMTENQKEMSTVSEYLVFTPSDVDTKGGCTITVTAKAATGAGATGSVAGADDILADFKSYSGEADAAFEFKYYINAQPNTTTTDDIPDGNLVGSQPTA